jgi:hypothetical protein
MTKTDQAFKQTASYLDAHCAAFNGWTIPTAKNQFEQQCIDRGHWDGLEAREKALED